MSVRSAASTSRTNQSHRSARSDVSRSTSGRSQLHWKMFRKNVLAPHHIRILESSSGENLPESIIAYIDINRTNTKHLASQRECFKQQVQAGQGFGASAFFPGEVLPTIEGKPFLSRCMVPSYSQDALPERRATKAGATSGLSIPRPGLGCGLAGMAFTQEELNAMPSYLVSTGTPLHFDTSSSSTNSAIYCPFLSFERAFSQNEYGLDVATNQCAVDGAWSVRAQQMVFAKAAGEEVKTKFEKPVSFTCCIDNDVAVMNYHWVDHAQTYCMAPLVKFDLKCDEHFDQLLVWIEAIEQWAITQLLPEIKRALAQFRSSVPIVLAPERPLTPPDTSDARKEELLLESLKTNFGTLAWHPNHMPLSPGVSSTASWGSPMVDESVFDYVEYSKTSRPRSVYSDSNIARVRFPPTPQLVRKSSLKSTSPPQLSMDEPGAATPEPAYEKNPNLIVKKRLGHAMTEIEELQTQLRLLKDEMSNTTSTLRAEIAELKQTMSCLIRKEKPTKSRSPLRINPPATLQLPNRSYSHGLITTPTDPKPHPFKSVVTTPTDPRAPPFRSRTVTRTPSGLQNVLTPLDTSISAVVSVKSPTSATAELQSATSLLSPGTSGVEDYMSALPERQSHASLPSPAQMRGQFIPHRRAPSPKRVLTPALTAPLPETQPPQPSVSQDEASVTILQSPGNIWSSVLATYMFSAVVPSVLFRVVFFGCLLDYFFISLTQPQTPTVMTYLNHLVKNISYVY
ncbi:hypothetical protein H2198_001927 [Neophaeococcomyces mojaviensis]|uniref:Uncharacterized protein n=1 Tax=Neophaeococcomyces mojaviensis TaxID=3383035 RepID=A0ACC3AG80_9EURO|nr:hypothetical protein H2198_001927 [Knufia sp. JES_112]